MDHSKINVEKHLIKAVKLPLIKIDREQFLSKELGKLYTPKQVDLAISNNPAYAGIEKDTINSIARHCINFETRRVTFTSAGLGLPGNPALMAATIPADVSQYFGSSLRILQKLAYLYGFPDFEINENEIDDRTMDEFIVFMGVMFGVQEANVLLKEIAEKAATSVANRLAKKALMRTMYYPIVKTIAHKLGYTMTKEIFAKGVSKGIPVLSGVISGGLTYATFKPCSLRLQNAISDFPICDPSTYEE